MWTRCLRATKLQQGRNSEALQLCLLHPAKVLLDKIWRCTVDEDEKGISFEKPVPYCLSPDAKT